MSPAGLAAAPMMKGMRLVSFIFGLDWELWFGKLEDPVGFGTREV